MGAMKQTSRSVPAWKPILAISAIVIAVAALFFGWQYTINRPNYRDLQKEFNKLSIPADWTLVSESSNKGVLGLFCWSLSDSPCPEYGKKYANQSNIDPETDQKFIEDTLILSGYQIVDRKLTNCAVQIGNKYFCYEQGTRSNIAAAISISKEVDSDTKKLSITLEPKSVTGIK